MRPSPPEDVHTIGPWCCHIQAYALRFVVLHSPLEVNLRLVFWIEIKQLSFFI